MTLAQAMTRLREADVVLQQGPTKPFAVPLGNLEAIVAGSMTALAPTDWWLPGLRERVGAVLREVPIERLSDAKQGARPYRVAPSDTSPAQRALIAVGTAQADRTHCALVHLGISALGDGDLHAALNLAGLLQPNVIFVLANQTLHADAPIGAQSASKPQAIGKAHGLNTKSIDGHSAKAVKAAVTAAKKKGGPHWIVADLQPPGTSLTPSTSPVESTT